MDKLPKVKKKVTKKMLKKHKRNFEKYEKVLIKVIESTPPPVRNLSLFEKPKRKWWEIWKR